MKYITIISVSLLLGISLLSLVSFQSKEETNDKVEFPNWIISTIPNELFFATESVPLCNYDTKESLKRELLATSYLHSKTFMTLLAIKRYFPIIEPIMKKYGIPDDFKYLCMAESGLNPNIRSYAGAGGLWQIMPATGRENGLKINKDIDERYHIEKATEVACRYLLNSYERFGSWTLAAAAYNLGNAGLARRLKTQGVSNYYDTFLPEETLRYVFRILSFKVITEDMEEYGFIINPNDYHKPLTEYKIIKTSERNIDWSKLAKENGSSYKMLRELNHWIRDYTYNNSKGEELEIKIPGENFRTKL